MNRRMNLGASSTKSTSTTSRIQNWTRERDTCLVGIMRQRFDAGDWANGSFTKNAWRQIVEDYNYANTENQVTLSQILNRWKVLKKEFNCFFNLRNKSGWGWDYERHCPVAPDRESWMQVDCYCFIPFLGFRHDW